MKILLLLIFFALTACATGPQHAPTTKTKMAKPPASNKAANNVETQNGEKTDEQRMADGVNLLSRSRTKQAIEECFDPVIVHCDAQYKDKHQKVYATRSPTETIFYMTLAAAANRDAIAVAPTCADALYFKAYGSLDLGKIEEAMTLLERALEWSPVNAMYLSELGHVYQVKGDFKKALELFREAESNAPTFSPDSVKNRELGRAKRGVGFILIEMGKLDEAEQKFKECLDIDKKDATALNELEYIRQIRGRSEERGKSEK